MFAWPVLAADALLPSRSSGPRRRLPRPRRPRGSSCPIAATRHTAAVWNRAGGTRAAPDSASSSTPRGPAGGATSQSRTASRPGSTATRIVRAEGCTSSVRGCACHASGPAGAGRAGTGASIRARGCAIGSRPITRKGSAPVSTSSDSGWCASAELPRPPPSMIEDLSQNIQTVDAGLARYVAAGGPNQVASASVSPSSVPFPTQAT